MSIGTVLINEEQLNWILSREESHFLDFKSKEILPSKLTRTLSAFANADGGEVYIGIEEDRSIFRWNGFDKIESANAHIQVFNKLFPLGQDYDYCFLKSANVSGLVLQVSIKKTQAIVPAHDEVVYVRRGAQNLAVNTQNGLESLRYQKGIASFEDELIEADISIITNSEPVIRFMLNVVPTAEPEAWLKKQQLIRGGKLAVAGILLFADEPSILLPKRAGIKLYRYKTTDTEGARGSLAFTPITIEGDIYSQIKKSVDSTVAVIEDMSIMGENGLEKPRYPRVALHEVITNAILHRDYSLADDIHIRIFDNRIEIESPGMLPGHITTKNILNERFARNGKLVRLINKYPDAPNKDVGEGLNTAFAAMRDLKFKDPVIEQRDNSVRVIIRHEPLASAEEMVMDFLKSNPEVTNSQARTFCFIGSENVMKRVFERLVKKSLIERVPGKQGNLAAYRLSTAQR